MRPAVLPKPAWPRSRRLRSRPAAAAGGVGGGHDADVGTLHGQGGIVELPLVYRDGHLLYFQADALHLGGDVVRRGDFWPQAASGSAMARASVKLPTRFFIIVHFSFYG